MKFLLCTFLLILWFEEAGSTCQSPHLCYCKLFATSTKTASSSYSSVFSPNQAAINNAYQATTGNGSTSIQNGGSWRPLDSDSSKWFILDFGSDKTIKNISTKGNAHFGHWISQYRVFIRANGASSYTNIKTTGNRNGNSANVIKFEKRARYVKIQSIQHYGSSSLRLEVQGCNQVNGGWSNWGSWRKCRSPCGTGIQFRWRSCSNPRPKFLGRKCTGIQHQFQTCNTHSCTPVTMTLELHLLGLAWNPALLTSGSPSDLLCLNLKTNLLAVYVPVSPISITVSCSFSKIGVDGVGVNADLTFNETNPIYNMKLQDGLYYDNKINTLPAVLRSFSSTQVPYKPRINSYESKSSSTFQVNYNASLTGPSPYGYEIYYRVNTSDPFGAWSTNNPGDARGNCDGSDGSRPVHNCHVRHLRPFHNYTVRLVPYSVHGYGFSSDPFWVTTMEAKPAPPANFSAIKASSTRLNVSWVAVPLVKMNGNSEGYQLGYKRADQQKWTSFRIRDHWVTSFNISGLDEYIDYDLRIKSKNSRMWGDVKELKVPVRTDQDVPAAPPRNLNLAGSSSTSLRITWNQVPTEHQNGVIINYKINISMGTFLDWRNSSMFTVNRNTRTKVITGLEKWTHYTARVAASTIKGVGPFSAPKTGRTSEDRPSVSPGGFHGAVNSSTVTTFWWKTIPYAQRHGVIRHYRVTSFPLNDVASKRYSFYHGATMNRGVVTNLWYWTFYNFSVAAKTSPGYGPESYQVTLRTEEHWPTKPPENFRGVNTSSYSIQLDWEAVPEEFRHGYILSYQIKYKSVKDAGWKTVINHGVSNMSLEITDLFNFTLYTIKLSAATIKGYGTEGIINVRTDDAIPTLPPASITARKTSSTSLSVTWQRIPAVSRHGIILGYLLNYTDMVFHTTQYTSKHNWGTLQLPLTSLEKYREYRIDIAGYTKKGVGPYTSTTEVTEEDVPSESPPNLTGSALSSTSVRFSWDLIPLLPRNGIIRKYKIKYTSLDTSPHVGSTEFNGGSLQQGTVSSLRYWTFYNFSINAATVKGYGVESTDITVRTEQHVPTRPPENFRGVNTSSYSIQLDWEAVPEEFRHGYILSYQIEYKSVKDAGWKTVINNGVSNMSLEITGLFNYTLYTIKLSAATIKGYGTEGIINVRTDDAIPTLPPASITARKTSSTSLLVTWQRIPWISRHGIILGYLLNYTDMVFHTTQYTSKHNWGTLQLPLTSLEKYREYRIDIAGYTKKGVGPYTSTTQVTDEDVPTEAPQNLAGSALSSTSIGLSWDLIPLLSRNGIIRKYKIKYTSLDTSPHVGSTEFSGGSLQQGTVSSLRYWTFYNFSINAATVKGYGVESTDITVRTEQHVPTRSPENFRGVNMSSYSIQLDWEAVPEEFRHGYILSYQIRYKSVKDAGWKTVINHGVSNMSLEITQLFNYTLYTIHLSAGTIKGYGTEGIIYVRTDDAIPTLPPASITASNTSSTSLSVTWQRIPEVSRHGIILGYLLNYTDMVFHTTQYTSKHNWGTLQLPLTSLEKYREYRIDIAGYTKKGVGPYTSTTQVTDEDVPTESPPNLAGSALSSTSIGLSWDLIPLLSRNGIIRKYKIKYTSLDTSPHVGSAEFSGGSLKQGTVSSLRYWTFYNFSINAATVKGYGVESTDITVRTQEHPPTRSPINIFGFNTSSYSIQLTWEPIEEEYRHGVILGYTIRYVSSGDSEFVLRNEGSGNVSLELKGLHNYTDYNISVSGYNSKGDGAAGMITVRTEESTPSQGPASVHSHNTSSTSLWIEWTKVPEIGRRGVILGYHVKFTHVRHNITGNVSLIGEDSLSYSLTDLDEFREYRIEVAGFTKMGIGRYTVTTAVTDEDIPAAPPASVAGQFSKSNGLAISWSNVPDEDQNGLIEAVTVYYKLFKRSAPVRAVDGKAYLKWLTDNKKGTGSGSRKRRSVNEYEVGILDEDLRDCLAFHLNQMKRQRGPYFQENREPVLSYDFCYRAMHYVENDFKTSFLKRMNPSKDNIPFKKIMDSPNDFASQSNSATQRQRYMSMKGNPSKANQRWGYISFNSNNGFPTSISWEGNNDDALKDTVPIKPITTTERHRQRRSTSDVSAFSSVTVAGNESGVMLNNLDPYVNYTIVVQANTKKGPGPLSQSILVETDESVPSAPPQNATASNTSSTSILTKWQPVPFADSNGIVYAYIVSVKMASSSGPWLNYTQYEPILEFHLTGLYKYVKYSIKICAVTSKGSGPFSPEVITTTDEDIPTAAPANVAGGSRTATTLRITWRPVPGNGVPSCCVHGVLSGYELWYGKRYPKAGDTVERLSVAAHLLSVDIPNLATFTPYFIEVAAKTIKGIGPKEKIFVWTTESIPTLPPQNVTVTNASSTSLMIEWNELPFMTRKGLIRGYAIYYKITRSNHPLSVLWLDMINFTGNYTVVYKPPFYVENDDVVRRLTYELKGLKKFMQYTIHLTSYNRVGTGPWTFADYAMTDEDVPSEPVVNVTGKAVSSSSILVTWQPIPITYDPTIEVPVCCIHGNLTGYTIFYTRVTKQITHSATVSLEYLKNATYHADLFSFTNLSSYTNASGNSSLNGNSTGNVSSSVMSFVLTGLDAAKNYSINVAGNTIKGPGALADVINVVTDEDVPSRGPNTTHGWKVSSTSIYLEWSDVLWEYRNGIIRRYIIYYRETADPRSTALRKFVDVQYNSTILFSLRKWTYYAIRVYGATSKGQGILSTNITLRTDQDVPSMPPQNITAFDYTGPYSILVKWAPVPIGFRHGVILGYKILYSKEFEAGEELDNKTTAVKTVSVAVNQTYLEYLPTYCTYKIQITAFTVKGNGPLSEPIFAKTCRCIKHLYTNWWKLSPYNYDVDLSNTAASSTGTSNLSFVPKGLFAGYLRDMAIWACGNCYGARGHGYSVVHFDVDKNGRKCQKESEKSCIAYVDDTVDFTFPVHGRSSQTSFLFGGKFLPYIVHPEAAMVVLKKVTYISRSKAMTSALMSMWPLILINLVFAAVAGFCIWSLDCGSNPDEFPSTVLEGMWQGFWWAYVTMTTVGYGDITPRSLPAKIFAILWILTGLVLYAILVSTITSALFVKEEIIVQKVKLYDNKIALVNGSFEERIALSHSARPVRRKTVAEILTMVKNDEIEAAFVDTYILSEFEHFFGKTALYVQRTLKSPSFNYGIGLMGDITKLVKLFKIYEESTRAEFSALLEKYISVSEKDEASASSNIDDDESMFSARSPMFVSTLSAILVMLSITTAGGIAITIFKSVKAKRLLIESEEIEKVRSKNPTVQLMEQLGEASSTTWEEFLATMTEKIEELEGHHLDEKLHLIHLYRFLDRSKREGVNVISKLKSHQIQIKDWDRCNKGIERMKNIGKRRMKNHSCYVKNDAFELRNKEDTIPSTSNSQSNTNSTSESPVTSNTSITDSKNDADFWTDIKKSNKVEPYKKLVTFQDLSRRRTSIDPLLSGSEETDI